MDLKKSENTIRTMKITLIVFFLSTAYFLPFETNAQDSLTEATTTEAAIQDPSDSLYQHEKADAFFKKMGQALKFRENRNRKEEERIHQLISERIKKGDLNLTDDSLKIVLDTIVKHLKDSIYDETLRELESVHYSCSCLAQEPDSSLIAKDSFCLRPKTQIIGWHRSGAGNRFKNYKYNYLTAINLYGYELTVDGTPKNPEVWNEFSADGGVIQYAQNNCTDIYLTVYNTSASEISMFLKNIAAQNRLLEKLNAYAISKKIMGVNIFFEDIRRQDADLFLSFIKEISKNLKSTDRQFVLSITIPMIHNDESLEKIAAYDFVALSLMVDNYLVLTDTMTIFETNRTRALSPLHGMENQKYGTIESTINFYGNSKIPFSKLSISLSYVGIRWPVNDFTGKIKAPDSRPTRIPYNTIVRSYLNNDDPKISVEQRFDSVQATAYLNVKASTKKNTTEYTQIWYEDRHSLSKKYEWVLNKNLAGVSIRGLGNDEGYTDLWDALGASLMRIDSIKDTSYRMKAKDDSKKHSNSSISNILMIAIGVIVLVFMGVFLLYKRSD